jgi:hypothetical protein
MTTVDLLHKLTDGKELTSFKDPSKVEYFALSEKQFKWLWGVFSGENMNADGKIAATVTDTDGSIWGLNWKNYIWNVPHFIPNRDKYGKTFYIHFVKK